MSIYSKFIVELFQKNKLVGILVALIGLFAVSHLFLFGYRISLDPLMRSFLDQHSSKELSVDFLTSWAFAVLSAKVLIFFAIYNLRNPKLLFLWSAISSRVVRKLLSKWLPKLSVEVEDTIRYRDIWIKLTARWLRKRELFCSAAIAMVVFAFVFIGSGWWLFILLSVGGGLVLWHLVGRVELRRAFATPTNTASISVERLVKAATIFLVLLVSYEAALSGYFKFRSRLNTTAIASMGNCEKNYSVIAVTSKGVLFVATSTGTQWFEVKRLVAPKFVPFDNLDHVSGETQPVLINCEQ